MKKFEDEMLKFAKPIFNSSTEVIANSRQKRIMSVWFSLIVILAEYAHTVGDNIAISYDDRAFIKRHLSLPNETWCIVACSLKGNKWKQRYRHHPSFMGQFRSRAEYNAAVAQGMPNNTQITSCGMGDIFIQAFSCPDPRYVEEFKISAKETGLIQLWPIPFRLWPFKERPTQFPTNLVINDDDADALADAFHNRLKEMTQPPFFGGQRVMLDR